MPLCASAALFVAQRRPPLFSFLLCVVRHKAKKPRGPFSGLLSSRRAAEILGGSFLGSLPGTHSVLCPFGLEFRAESYMSLITRLRIIANKSTSFENSKNGLRPASLTIVTPLE